MTRKTTVSIAAFTALFAAGIAGAATFVGQSETDADAAVVAVKTDSAERDAYVLSAMDLFHQIDLDGNEIVSENEYVGYLIADAELTRLNGAVMLASDERTPSALPAMTDPALTADERDALLTDARWEYNAVAGNDGRMSVDEFALTRAHRFDRADRNADGKLTGEEITAFAAEQARTYAEPTPVGVSA